MSVQIPNLIDCIQLAMGAGEILRAGFTRRPGSEAKLKVDYKGTIDLVTEIDHRSEAYLLGIIQERFPDHRIVAEESGAIPGDDCCQWFVDPLDGTVNYAHGVPIFSVSIAFSENGHLKYGVVYDPIQDEFFSAERGKGAWLNGEPIQVSTTDELDKSLLVTGFPYDIRNNPDNNLDHYARFALRSQGVRRLGSVALDLCYVAAGRFDGLWELRLNPWDIAAGGLIAREAGALVTTFEGDPDFISPPYSLIAANPSLHQQILKTIREK
jgi:myo-inositol-1(or 4)-monophosphatase